MKILAIEKEVVGANADYLPHLKAEALCVWELQQAGVIRDIAFTVSDRRAIITLECASETEAGAVLATLPLVRENCIAFDVFGLRAYDGFARLFAAPGVGKSRFNKVIAAKRPRARTAALDASFTSAAMTLLKPL